MSEYVLNITKRRENPEYKPLKRDPYDAYNSRDDRTPIQTMEYLDEVALSVTIPEETFAAIRKAMVESL